MDEEQIWQQLELQNEEMITNSIKSASRMLAGNQDKFKIDIDESSDNEEEAQSGADDGEEQSENEAEDMYALNSQGEEEENEDDEGEGEDSDLDLNDPNEESILPKKPSKQSNSFKSSEIDDKFFKLSEMEDYCDQNNSITKNGEIDYINLLEKIRRKQNQSDNTDTKSRFYDSKGRDEDQ